MKCIRKAIHFDGLNLRFRGVRLMKAPKDLVNATQPIPKSRMFEVKQNIINNVWGAVQ